MIHHFGHHRLNTPVRRQMFSGVRVTEKYGQIYIGELELCNDSGVHLLQPRFHLSGVLYWGDSQLVQALILLQFSHPGNHRAEVECTGAVLNLLSYVYERMINMRIHAIFSSNARTTRTSKGRFLTVSCF